MTRRSIERAAGAVAEFYEAPTTPVGIASTFVSIYRLLLGLLKCPPEIAFEITAKCFPCEYGAFLASIARGALRVDERPAPYAGRMGLSFPELN